LIPTIINHSLVTINKELNLEKARVFLVEKPRVL
jgi:hypothetical protein